MEAPVKEREKRRTILEEASKKWEAPKKGTIVFTKGYASPEQELYGVSNIQSDIYSVGAVIYFLATGHVPQYFQRVRNMPLGDFPQISEGLGFSKQLINIVKKATENEPEKRFRNAREMFVALDYPDYISQEKSLPANKPYREKTSPKTERKKRIPHKKKTPLRVKKLKKPIKPKIPSPSISPGEIWEPAARDSTNFNYVSPEELLENIDTNASAPFDESSTDGIPIINFGEDSYVIVPPMFIGKERNNPEVVPVNDPLNLLHEKHVAILDDDGRYCLKSLDWERPFFHIHERGIDEKRIYYPKEGDWFSLGYVEEEERPYMIFRFEYDYLREAIEDVDDEERNWVLFPKKAIRKRRNKV